MLADQDGKCAICWCKSQGERRRFAVDHCHNSGKVRGLLCDNCNKGIGNLKHSPEILARAITYLTA
jgi:hypothetical protein